MADPNSDVYLVKAEESLTGAESAYVNGRAKTCANRAYYACFQAAVAGLIQANVACADQAARWDHAAVRARFVGELINCRKRYPAALRETRIRGLRLRQTADSKTERGSAVQASRGLARARAFVTADTDEVFEVVVGRLLEMQVEEGLSVYVIPVRPLARVAAEVRPRDAVAPHTPVPV